MRTPAPRCQDFVFGCALKLTALPRQNKACNSYIAVPLVLGHEAMKFIPRGADRRWVGHRPPEERASAPPPSPPTDRHP
jgi:hypothetical protein